ncbi:hypothetical protein EZV62_012847 [Acer yangbiense]|uniref:Oxidative stress 3 n=1 Tax=Acer yangbiense TaxID=1000413 RepID=A0A5C7HXD8_9ROSI|nr:hypothetical protein EZV62_012847 [Acer yangbiense]
MEGGKKMFQHLNLRKIIDDGNYDNGGFRDDKWVVMMKGGGEICDHSISNIEDDSIKYSPSSSLSSSSSSDFVEEDDASSSSTSSTSSSSSSSNGPLYELSALMAQLPIKRGLSKFYQGKSQSFTSLVNVNNIEDLAKKENIYSSYKMRMKSCKSYAAGLDIGGRHHHHHHHHHNNKSISPKATIAKNSSRVSPFLSSLGKRTSLVTGCKPAISVQRNF